MIKNRLRTVLMILFAAIFIFCIVRLVMIRVQYEQGNEIYSSAVDHYVSSIPETADVPEPASNTIPDLGIDFEALKSVNEDIIGWIWIPGTEVNYPLLKGDDNTKYLETTFDGEKSIFGSIFMDYRCSSDFSDRNTVIYGHNMKNNSMFGSLSDYSDPDYNKLHHSVYIFTPENSYRYDIVSSYKTKINTKSYINQFRSDESFMEFLQFILESSKGIDTANAQLEASDKILTLSTCVDSGARNYRYVLHAVLSVTE